MQASADKCRQVLALCMHIVKHWFAYSADACRQVQVVACTVSARWHLSLSGAEISLRLAGGRVTGGRRVNPSE